MPVIISRKQEADYLRYDLTINEIKDLLSPIDTDYLNAYTISKRVTSTTQKRNISEAIKPYNYPELPPI
jgi:putative SOS response-associated peptidase YedK